MELRKPEKMLRRQACGHACLLLWAHLGKRIAPTYGVWLSSCDPCWQMGRQEGRHGGAA